MGNSSSARRKQYNIRSDHQSDPVSTDTFQTAEHQNANSELSLSFENVSSIPLSITSKASLKDNSLS